MRLIISQASAYMAARHSTTQHCWALARLFLTDRLALQGWVALQRTSKPPELQKKQNPQTTIIKKTSYCLEILYDKFSPFIISAILVVYHILCFLFPYNLTIEEQSNLKGIIEIQSKALNFCIKIRHIKIVSFYPLIFIIIFAVF